MHFLSSEPTTSQPTADVYPPVLQSFSCTPRVVTKQDQRSKCTAVYSDATGVVGNTGVASILYRNATGVQKMQSVFWRASGNSTWSVHQDARSLGGLYDSPGEWNISLSIADTLNNKRDYTTADLVAMGFHSSVIVNVSACYFNNGGCVAPTQHCVGFTSITCQGPTSQPTTAGVDVDHYYYDHSTTITPCTALIRLVLLRIQYYYYYYYYYYCSYFAIRQPRP